MTVHPKSGGAVDVWAAVLPALNFVPTVHLHHAETVMPIFDGLPAHTRREPQASV